MRHTISDYDLLDQDPRASMAVGFGRCGGGKPQPGWGVCPDPAAWRVRTPSGGDYTHDYCTRHAAMRLRAADVLEQRAKLHRKERRP